MSRRREYDFAWLRVGDRLVVAVNVCAPDDLRFRINSAAKQYRRCHDPSFQFTTSTTALPGFVVLERIEGGDRSRLMHDKAQANLSRLRAVEARHGSDCRLRQRQAYARRRLKAHAA